MERYFNPLKKVYRKRLVRFILILFPLLTVAGVLLYVKVSGFKKALEELVLSESQGEYSLTIETSSISISTLSFTFDNLSIQRNPNSMRKGIRVVSIPYLQVRFGSAASMLKLKQFDIEQLVVEEPTVEIDAFNMSDSTAKENILWSQEIVQLYPAVESLLSRFDIKSLMINRASVGMNKTGISVMKLNLVDLLVEQWNIKQLTSSSQLQLKIGGQELNFGKSTLNFSGIEFNFRRHHLTFSDFSFSSVDTVSYSKITVAGKSLVLRQLDYKDLYDNKRYSIKRAEVNNPVVTAHFRLKKRTKKIDDRGVLTRLLKHSLGECSVDSTIIRDARVQMVLQQGNDSVKVHLPRVNFKLHSFKVLADSNTFQLGDIEVDLNRTAIGLKKNMSLHCDRIFFDTKRNLNLTGVMFYDSLKRETIARCEKLNLENFNLLDFVFYKNVMADAVTLENGYVHATGGPGNHLTPDKQKFRGINDVTIRNVSLKHVALLYTDAEKNISADQLSVLLSRVRRDTSGGFQYTIEKIYLRSALLNGVAHGTTARIKNLDFNGKTILLGEIDLQRDSLHIHAKELSSEKSGDAPIQKNYRHWKIARIKTLSVSGPLPRQRKEPRMKNENIQVSFDEINVDNVVVSTSVGSMTLVGTGSGIHVNEVFSSPEGWTHGDIRGKFSDVLVRSPGLTARVGELDVRFPAEIRAAKMDVLQNDIMVSLPSLSIRSIMEREKTWAIKSITSTQVMIARNGAQLLRADSAKVANVRFAGQSNPTIESLEVFKPEIFLGNGDREAMPGHKKQEFFPMPDHLLVYPGIIHLSNKKSIPFGKIQGSIAKENLTCTFIRFENEKMRAQLNSISLDENQLTIDSVSMRPVDQWFKANAIENDLIRADLRGLQIKGFDARNFFETKSTRNLHVILDHFELDIKRDKRLPDPPVKEKPTTLEGLIKLPEGLGIKTIDMKGGRLRYTETSEKTSADGMVLLEGIAALVEFDTTRSFSHVRSMKAKARLYNAGNMDVHYATLDSSSFKLAVRLKEFDLTHLNQVVVPLQSLQIKSGYLIQYDLDVTADNDKAFGNATITYKDLHLEIFKPTEPERKTLGTELLTLLADGIILKHSKKNALAPVEQSRLKHKSIFNYWVKSAVHGAMGAIRKGKTKKAA